MFLGLVRFEAWDVVRLGLVGVGTFYRWDLLWLYVFNQTKYLFCFNYDI